MKKVEYFGNLINEQVNLERIRDFENKAIPQKNYRSGVFQVYLLDDEIAVARKKGNKITRYTVLGKREDYRTIYTNSRDSVDILKQALYHGACILTNRGGKAIGLGYDL